MALSKAVYRGIRTGVVKSFHLPLTLVFRYNSREESWLDNQEFIEFFLRVMYECHFGSKRKMAAALKIEYRTLQKNFSTVDSPKRAFLAFQNLVLLCEDKDISIDLLYLFYQEGIVPKASAPGKLSGSSRKSRHLHFPGAQKEV